MSDHHHYGEYAEARHDHRGEYTADRHDHDLDYAEKHHRHYDLEREGPSTAQFVTALRDELVNVRRERRARSHLPDAAAPQGRPATRAPGCSRRSAHIRHEAGTPTAQSGCHN